MANMLINQATQDLDGPPRYQAKDYLDGRPSYPEELFQFIASKTPGHDLAWDAGTGNGQAAKSVAKIYKNVIATDVSQKQLELAPELLNVQYKCTPPKMSMAELEQAVGKESSVDLVTVATAMHHFDLPSFYQQVKWVLKKPNGVIAAWTYRIPTISTTVDSIFYRIYEVDCDPYFAPQVKLVNDEYKTVDFPFEPVDGCDHTGPFEFKIEKLMDLEGLLTLIRSWSSYKTAKEKGVEVLGDEVIEDLKRAWNEDGQTQKVATYTIFLRIGKVGSSN